MTGNPRTGQRIDLTGQRFGTYTAVKRKVKRNGRGAAVGLWLCLCDCGRERWIQIGQLRPKLVASCPCTRTDKLEGTTVGRLTVLNFTHRRKPCGKLVKYYRCRCQCGKECEVLYSHLRSGGTASCGCFRREQAAEFFTTHGESRSKHGNPKPTPEYSAYQGAKARCTNPNLAGWKHYGGRGIRFLFESFEEFLACVGRRPSADHSLDRVDVNGNYEAGNLRWASKKEQSQNRRNRRRIICPNCSHRIDGAMYVKQRN